MTALAQKAARRLYDASMIDQHEEPKAVEIIDDATSDLLAALEPFAEQAKWLEGVADSITLYRLDARDEKKLTAGDFRRAAEAVRKARGG